MIIVGAGMAGLVAAHYFKRHNPVIYEAQPTLPNNHDALLRFRTDKVAKLTGIDFKKVEVRKAIFSEGQYHAHCNPRLANQYSAKVCDEIISRSIWDLAPVERYIAPADFINRASAGCDIHYSSALTSVGGLSDSQAVISTIPMPSLMALSQWPGAPKFNFRPIWTITADICIPSYVDVYQTIYFPGSEMEFAPVYRASITGDRLIVECVSDPNAKSINDHVDYLAAVGRRFGLPGGYSNIEIKKQQYGKLVPLRSDAGHSFMYSMTQEHNIYSLGRFATWRQLLMDDVVDDCEVIEKLMTSRARLSSYHEHLRRARLP